MRLYDTRAQRRPIYSTEFGDVPVTALTVLEDGRLENCSKLLSLCTQMEGGWEMLLAVIISVHICDSPV